jgi:hypothetical protein
MDTMLLYCLGFENGLELKRRNNGSGAAFGDRNGYTLTFDGLESRPLAFLEDYTTNI